MKVCAHFSIAPFHQYHERFQTIGEAIDHLREYGRYDSFEDEERPCVDVYPQCPECDSVCNFHDYPMARYELGPRNGIKKVSM